MLRMRVVWLRVPWATQLLHLIDVFQQLGSGSCAGAASPSGTALLAACIVRGTASSCTFSTSGNPGPIVVPEPPLPLAQPSWLPALVRGPPAAVCNIRGSAGCSCKDGLWLRRGHGLQLRLSCPGCASATVSAGRGMTGLPYRGGCVEFAASIEGPGFSRVYTLFTE